MDGGRGDTPRPKLTTHHRHGERADEKDQTDRIPDCATGDCADRPQVTVPTDHGLRSVCGLLTVPQMTVLWNDTYTAPVESLLPRVSRSHKRPPEGSHISSNSVKRARPRAPASSRALHTPTSERRLRAIRFLAARLIALSPSAAPCMTQAAERRCE